MLHSIAVSVQCCYTGNLGSIPRAGGGDGKYLHKMQLHPTKGVKTGTSSMCEDSMVPSGATADLN